MNANDFVLEFERNEARRLCEMLACFRELGIALRPSRIFPRGRAVDPKSYSVDCSQEAFRRLDREHSQGLLDWSARVTQQLPDIAADFSEVLSEGRRTWERLAAA